MASASVVMWLVHLKVPPVGRWDLGGLRVGVMVILT